VIAAEPSHTMGPSSAVPADLLRETDRPHRLPASAVAWLVVVGALPLAELALLSSRFDASVLEARGGWLAHAIGASGDLVRAALPLLAAALLVGAARLRVVRPALLGAFASARRPWAALLGHLACFGALVVLSPGVFSDPDPGAALLVAWVVTGLAAAALWVAALVPDVMRRGAGLLLGGTLLAGAALGILAAGAATVTRDWWEPLGRSTVWTGDYLLRALGVDAGVDPEHFLVGTRSFVVEITPYCSGYQGIGLMWVFLAAYLWLFRERLRFPRALWLLPIGTLLVWLLNAVRIAVLVLIGSAGHEDVAMGGFHYHAGTLLFCATALGIGTWAASSRTFGTVRRARSEPGENPTAAYVLPLLALLATSLVTGAFSRGGFDPLYAVRVVAAASVVWTMRARLAGAGWRPSWVGAALGLAGFAVWVALAAPEAPAAIPELTPVARIAWIVTRLTGAVVIVPLVEELAFRGYLARRLTAAEFDAVSLRQITWPALLASSVLFGLMHHDVVAGAAVGILYGLAARRRGRLGDAVLAHAVTNALLAVTGRMSLPG
jgi:exosortase E/protease (VPEID-CTERM system)